MKRIVPETRYPESVPFCVDGILYGVDQAEVIQKGRLKRKLVGYRIIDIVKLAVIGIGAQAGIGLVPLIGDVVKVYRYHCGGLVVFSQKRDVDDTCNQRERQDQAKHLEDSFFHYSHYPYSKRRERSLPTTIQGIPGFFHG